MDKPLEALNTTDEISQYLDDKRKELQGAVSNLSVIEARKYVLDRDIIDLELKTKEKKRELLDIKEAQTKAKANVSQLRIEVDRAERRYWRVRE